MNQQLLEEVRRCQACAASLPFSPRPIVQASPEAKILIIGQAPGLKVNTSGIPWDDKSGEELRRWLGVTVDQFYDAQLFALMPMGFCYPGKSKTGDLPPRPECAPLWHHRLLSTMPGIQLTLLIGKYAQEYYLKQRSHPSVTENIRDFKAFLPEYLPLVHPSPRNNIWKKKNPWFEQELIPELRQITTMAIGGYLPNRALKE